MEICFYLPCSSILHACLSWGCYLPSAKKYPQRNVPVMNQAGMWVWKVIQIVIQDHHSWPNQHLPIQSQQWQYQIKVWNMFKVSNVFAKQPEELFPKLSFSMNYTGCFKKNCPIKKHFSKNAKKLKKVFQIIYKFWSRRKGKTNNKQNVIKLFQYL